MDIKLKSSSDYLSKYRLNLKWDGIDLEEAKRVGNKVIHNGVLVAYYVDDGFDNYSAYASVSRGNFSNAFRIANVVSFLNKDIDVNILFNYMDLVCSEYFDKNNLLVDRKTILKNIQKVRDGLYDITPSVKKFFWVNEYTRIGKNDRIINEVEYDGKSKIVMSYYNKSKRIESVYKIEQAVNLLIEVGNKTNTFITIKDICEITDVSVSTAKRLSFLFKEDIDKYNMSNFTSSNYGEFLKFCSVNKITSAINLMIKELEYKITQRKVANKSGLHFNTVCTLWYEDEIQESLNEYNKWLVNNK